MTTKTTALRVVESEESGYGKPLPVRYSRIERYPDQPRRTFPQKELEELADSIQEEGQKTPVRVCKHSTKPGYFVLIGGERRWRAFGIIMERTGEDPIVNCFIDVIHDDRHHFREALLDNLQRVDLVPLDEARSYQRLFDESKLGSKNAKINEIARLVKKSITHIESYLYLHSLPDEVKALMSLERHKDERLTVTAAIDIARSTKHPTLRLTIAKEAVERGLGINETRSLISIKTGKSGYGIGGSDRKPSDDYKMIKAFLGHSLNRVRRLKQLAVNELYRSRDDEFGDRKRDSETLQELIGYLHDLNKEIEEKKK